MKVRDLKLALEQYDDDSLVLTLLSQGTVYNINKCIIDSCKHDTDLYEIKHTLKDSYTNSVILTVE